MTLTNTYVQLNSYCPGARIKTVDVLVWVGNTSSLQLYIFCYFVVWGDLGLSIPMQTQSPNADTIPPVFSCEKKHSTLSPTTQNLPTVLLSPRPRKAVREGSDEVTYWMSNAPSLSGVSFSSLNVVARVLGGTGCTYDP
jgi:hypothetical protein